ncbi:hypothetical protein OAA09_01140 [bacterium]|nr:hypothetical protein [bacterium]
MSNEKTSVTVKKFYRVRLLKEIPAGDGVAYRGLFETEHQPVINHIYIPKMDLDVSLDDVELTPMEKITILTELIREV